MSYFDNRDGRRVSNPLTTVSTSPTEAPGWQLSRVVTGQDGATEFAKKSKGVHTSNYEMIRFAVTPMTADPTKGAAVLGGTADVNTVIRMWSEQAQLFLPLHTAIVGTGLGAGVAYIIDVPVAYGSIVGCFTTEDPSGEFVAISAQGFKRSPLA